MDLKLSESIEAQMDEVYDPWYEKAYCVDLKKGIVWNVRDGGACWVVFPEFLHGTDELADRTTAASIHIYHEHLIHL